MVIFNSYVKLPEGSAEVIRNRPAPIALMCNPVFHYELAKNSLHISAHEILARVIKREAEVHWDYPLVI